MKNLSNPDLSLIRAKRKTLPGDSSIASPPFSPSAAAQPSSNPPAIPNKAGGEVDAAAGKATHQPSATAIPTASVEVPGPTAAASGETQLPSASTGNVQPTSPATGLEPSASTTPPRTPLREITPDDVRAMRKQLLLRPSRITQQTRLLRVPISFVPVSLFHFVHRYRV